MRWWTSEACCIRVHAETEHQCWCNIPQVCVEKVSNVIGKKEDWTDPVIYVKDGPHNLNRYKIAIHIVYLLRHSTFWNGKVVYGTSWNGYVVCEKTCAWVPTVWWKLYAFCSLWNLYQVYNHLQRIHIKVMTKLGMSVFPKKWYQSFNINAWVILDKHIHNRLMVVAIKEDSSRHRLESKRILHAIVMDWNRKGYS
jgi:hypothetical protein